MNIIFIEYMNWIFIFRFFTYTLDSGLIIPTASIKAECVAYLCFFFFFTWCHAFFWKHTLTENEIPWLLVKKKKSTGKKCQTLRKQIIHKSVNCDYLGLNLHTWKCRSTCTTNYFTMFRWQRPGWLCASRLEFTSQSQYCLSHQIVPLLIMCFMLAYTVISAHWKLHPMHKYKFCFHQIVVKLVQVSKARVVF